MPRLNPNFARCVFFLHARNPHTGELSEPRGTGLLIGTGSLNRLFGDMYAVTCAHVAPQGASVIRINTNDGGSRTIDLEPDDWITPSHNGADVAATDITDKISHDDNIRFITPSWFVGKEFIERAQIGIGEDGFMIGLFASQPGKTRNLVAGRFGNLSMLANDDAPIGWEGRPPIPAHLFDLRSRGGFSGSPVFIYRTPNGDLTDVTITGQRRRTTVTPKITVTEPRYRGRGDDDIELEWDTEHDIADNLFIRFLGLHAAQYPEVVKARKARKDAKTEAADDIIRDGDRFSLSKAA